MQKAVTFDVDGTLINSVNLHAGAWQNAFSDFSHQIAFEDIRSQIGKGGDQFIPPWSCQPWLAASRAS